ncbi:MAG: phosphatidylserine/phosphatidylglycerophosphate/cardiolipin synthase family protein [Candidatus Vogelbacteria bacterium]|nr:phosphatidylserine/phosphatidylglycerophosphate/cardiolipin synthase family protein [Candidatus Vogelbacteria bacterium]
MIAHKFYTNSERSWVAMLDAIKTAQKNIYWESYIFEDDMSPQFNFFDTLIAKARRGVRVAIVLDGFGSLGLSNQSITRLTEAGVDIVFFNRWFRRIHRKVLIVDNSLVFLGGVNIGDKYKKWMDLHVRLSGKNIVKALTRSFAQSYFFAGGIDNEILKLRKGVKLKKTKLWLLENFPWVGKLMLRPFYKEKIALSQERITLVTPYFVPHRWLIKSLERARARGVRVDVIVPADTDALFFNFVNHVFVSSLSKSGINFFMTKDMIHAKAFLVDDKVGLVGSNNIDALSFDINAEAGITFKNKEMVRDLKNIIDIWEADAVPFKHNSKFESWPYKIAEWLVRIIQPVL